MPEIPKYDWRVPLATDLGLAIAVVCYFFQVPDWDMLTRVLVFLISLLLPLSLYTIIYAVKLNKSVTAIVQYSTEIQKKHVHLAKMHDEKIVELQRKNREIGDYRRVKIEVLGKYLAAIVFNNTGSIPATENAYLQVLSMIEKEYM